MIGRARRWLASGILLGLLAFLLMPMSAVAQARPAPPVRHATVASVQAWAVPARYVGHDRYIFIRVYARAYLRDNYHGMRIVYRWQRSDGSGTNYRVINVRPGQREVQLQPPDMIPIRYGTHSGYNWDQVRIIEPNRINSNLAFFYIHWTRP